MTTLQQIAAVEGYGVHTQDGWVIQDDPRNQCSWAEKVDPVTGRVVASVYADGERHAYAIYDEIASYEIAIEDGTACPERRVG